MVDVNQINPFLKAFQTVLPQLGFASVEKKNLSLVEKITAHGIAVTVGIVGDYNGTVVYNFRTEDAKKMASKMMMGMEVADLDEMALSALSELTNMLTANAAIEFSNMGKEVNISTPTLVTGEDLVVQISAKKILLIEMQAEDIFINVNVGFENNA